MLRRPTPLALSLLLSLACAAHAPARAQGAAPAVLAYKNYAPPQYKEAVVSSFYVTMRDGVRIAVDVALPAGSTLRWLPRDGAARGSRLVPAVHAALCELGIASTPAAPPEEIGDELLWEVPDPDAASGCYAWLAGEAGVVRALRRRLVGDLGVPRGSVAFMGYWRQGVAS